MDDARIRKQIGNCLEGKALSDITLEQLKVYELIRIADTLGEIEILLSVISETLSKEKK